MLLTMLAFFDIEEDAEQNQGTGDWMLEEMDGNVHSHYTAIPTPHCL